MIVVLLMLGLLVGSFLNVVILRLHDGASPWTGRSHCPKCGRVLAWYELIPVISFLALLGRCRSCYQRISWQYPLVELATGLSFAGLAWSISDPNRLALYLVLTCFLILLFVYDARWKLVPDHFVIPAIGISVIGRLLLGDAWQDLLIGGIIGAGFFLLQYLVSRGQWIGSGDIRIGALMGVMLGWKATIVALMAAYIVGAVIGILLLALHKATRKTPIAFGMFLTAATYGVALFQEQITAFFDTLFL